MSTQAERIAVAANRLDGHDEQLDDHEKRMRQLELEHTLLRLARRELARTRREMPQLAEQAATRAVEKVLENRRKRRIEHLSTRVQVAATALGALSAGAGIAALFHL